MSAPPAQEDSVRRRRLIGASGRPLNFTVRRRLGKSRVTVRPLRSHIRCAEPCFRRGRRRWRRSSPRQMRLAPASGRQAVVAGILCGAIWLSTGHCGYRVSEGAAVGTPARARYAIARPLGKRFREGAV